MKASPISRPDPECPIRPSTSKRAGGSAWAWRWPSASFMYPTTITAPTEKTKK